MEATTTHHISRITIRRYADRIDAAVAQLSAAHDIAVALDALDANEHPLIAAEQDRARRLVRELDDDLCSIMEEAITAGIDFDDDGEVIGR